MSSGEAQAVPSAGAAQTGAEGDEGLVFKVVLTGGPCAGKTTTLARLRTFFENLGWKVYTVPETATILLGGGVRWEEATPRQAEQFQENLLKTMVQIEQTFFDLAEQDKGKVLIVCDRGTMDPSAFCSEEEWRGLLSKNGWSSVQLRDTRYDMIVHMVTAARGAEPFYQTSNNSTRMEGLELARERDTRAAQAWVGHPYVDSIDNSTDFEGKILRVVEAVCKRLGSRLGVDIDDRLQAQSKKRKFLVKALPQADAYPMRVKDFDVCHDYLLSSSSDTQSRIRKRGEGGHYMYTLTERRTVNQEWVEHIKQLTKREYGILLRQRDPGHTPVHKTRRCFLWEGHFFQLDIFKEPCSDRCHGLVLLETYTSQSGRHLRLPGFLDIDREVTGAKDFSMFNLSALPPTPANGPPPHEH